MPSYVRDIVQGYLRYFLVGWGTWMIRNGIATPDQYEQLLGGIATVLVAVVWVALAKWKVSKLLHTAMALPPSSPQTVARLMSHGMSAPAVVPSDDVPQIRQRVYRLR